MRDNSWIDPDGKLDFKILPVGDYSEVRHSGCYRAFNASREIKVYKYASRVSVSVDPGVWTKMKHELASSKLSGVKVNKSGAFDRLQVYPKRCSSAPKSYLTLGIGFWVLF